MTTFAEVPITSVAWGITDCDRVVILEAAWRLAEIGFSLAE